MSARLFVREGISGNFKQIVVGFSFVFFSLAHLTFLSRPGCRLSDDVRLSREANETTTNVVSSLSFFFSIPFGKITAVSLLCRLHQPKAKKRQARIDSKGLRIPRSVEESQRKERTVTAGRADVCDSYSH